MNNSLLLLLFACCIAFAFDTAHFPTNTLRHGDDPTTGFFLDGKNHKTYGLFSKAIKSVQDRPFFQANGEIADDDDVYTVGEKAKLLDPTFKGNLLTISNIDQTITALGQFEVCPEMPEIGFKLAGLATGRLETPVEKGTEMAPTGLTMDWVAGFDFNLPKSLMKLMLADFGTKPNRDTTLVQYGNKSPAHQVAWMEWSSKEKKKNDLLAHWKSGGTFDLPSEDTPGTLTLGDLGMTWHSELQSFVTDKRKAVLINMGKQAMHYYSETMAEFHMPANKNDQIRLLLNSPNGHYYFFSYLNGMLHTCSSNKAYNDILINMKEKDALVEVVKGQPYELHFATAYAVELFRKRMNGETF